MKNDSNKSIVLNFYRDIIRDCKSELLDDYIHDEYVQHSPSLKAGKAALFEAIEYLKQFPKQKTTPPFVIAIEDGDYVVLLLDLIFKGRKSVTDVFRLRDGKVVEHWDAIQNEPESKSKRDHILPIEAAENTDHNKLLIRRFFDAVIENSVIREINFTDDYVEHSTEVIDSGKRLDEYLIEGSAGFIHKIHRIFAEGNVIAVQTEGSRKGEPFVFYDFFRIANSRIAEHWGVAQRIPDQMPHQNGMI